MQKVKIFVACHKPSNVFKNDVYIPIHVGRSISKYKKEMEDMIGDDTGDNISQKNPYYSEMTAQYWAWKNVTDTEYIGFCHYRRLFEPQITASNIDEIIDSKTDVVLAGPVIRNKGRFEYLKNYVGPEDLAIMLYCVKKIYPDYFQTLSDYAYGYIDYPINMLICRKPLFDKYAKWVFDILFECEKYIKLSPYSRARRVFGYLSEFLLPVFFIHNGYSIKALKYTLQDGRVRGGIRKSSLLKYRIIDWLTYRNDKPSLHVDYAINEGLKADNILGPDNF